MSKRPVAKENRGQIVYYDLFPDEGGFKGRVAASLTRGHMRLEEAISMDVSIGPLRSDPSAAIADTWEMMNDMAGLGNSLHTGRSFSPYRRRK